MPISDYMADTARDLVGMRSFMPGLEKIVAIGAIGWGPSWGEISARQPATDRKNTSQNASHGQS